MWRSPQNRFVHFFQLPFLSTRIWVDVKSKEPHEDEEEAIWFGI